MKIKNFLKVLSLVMCIALVNPVNVLAVGPVKTVVATDPAKEAQMLANITARVNEIQNMDKENLTGAEKKALRTELKDMKKQASALDQRVYLSVGAVIIIILLLILILR